MVYSAEITIFVRPEYRHTRGVAQLASASGLGPEGRVFESHHPDMKAACRILQAAFVCQPMTCQPTTHTSTCRSKVMY